MYKRSIFMKTAAAVLSASMLFQTAVTAAPVDELTAISEKQMELVEDQKSLLDQYVDFSGIGEAADENGLQLQVNGSMEAEGLKISLDTNLQAEKDLQKWLLELGLDLQDTDFLDVSLFADSDMLALSVPQLLSKAVAIRSGGLADQLEGSALSEMLELPEIPDLNLQFVPDMTPGKEHAFDSLEEEAEAFEQKMQVEKTEDGDTTIYTVTYKTEDILELYRKAAEGYLEVFENLGIPVTVNGSDDVEGELEKGLTTLQEILGDELSMDYYVKEDLIQSLHYEIYVDPAVFGNDKTAQEDGVTVDGESAAKPMYVVFELTYTDPGNPGHGFVCRITPQDETRREMGTIDVVFACGNDGTVETHTYTLNISAEEEQISHTLYQSVFDQSTGKFTVEASIPEDPGSRASMAAALKLDSTFSEVESGRSFVLTVDELSGEAGGESGSVSGEIRVSADPDEIAEPEDPHMLPELTQEEITSVVMELAMKFQSWQTRVNELFGSGSEGETEMTEMTEMMTE